MSHTLVLGGILGAAILDSVTGRKKLGDLGANMLGEAEEMFKFHVFVIRCMSAHFVRFYLR